MFVCSRENLVTIEEISSLPVSVWVKVVAEEETEMKEGLMQQDYWIVMPLYKDCDMARLHWAAEWLLCGLLVCTQEGEKYLSVPKDGFWVSDIDVIGVVEGTIPEEQVAESK